MINSSGLNGFSAAEDEARAGALASTDFPGLEVERERSSSRAVTIFSLSCLAGWSGFGAFGFAFSGAGLGLADGEVRVDVEAPVLLAPAFVVEDTPASAFREFEDGGLDDVRLVSLTLASTAGVGAAAGDGFGDLFVVGFLSGAASTEASNKSSVGTSEALTLDPGAPNLVFNRTASRANVVVI